MKEAENRPVAPVFPGLRFSPTDQELIMYYLRRKIEGSLDKSVEIITELDVYKHEPWDLPSKSIMESDSEWFFFSPRLKKYPNGSQRRRATETGYWKVTGKDREVKSGSKLVGTKRTLVFHMGRAPKGSRTEWTMHEYCMAEKSQDSLVICRLRKKSESKSPNPSTEEGSNGTSRLCAGGESNPSIDSDVGFGSEVNRGTADEIKSEWKISSGGAGSKSSGNTSYGSHSVEHEQQLPSGCSSHKSSSKDESLYVPQYSPRKELSHRGGVVDENDYFAEILNDNIVNLDEPLPPPPPQPPPSLPSSSSTVIRHQPKDNHHQPATVVDQHTAEPANRRIRLRKPKQPHHDRSRRQGILLPNKTTNNRRPLCVAVTTLLVAVVMLLRFLGGKPVD